MAFKGHLGQPLSRLACYFPLEEDFPGTGLILECQSTPSSDCLWHFPCYNSSSSAPGSLVSDSLTSWAAAAAPTSGKHLQVFREQSAFGTAEASNIRDNIGHVWYACILQWLTNNWELKCFSPLRKGHFAWFPSFLVKLCINTFIFASSWLGHFSTTVCPCSSSRGLMQVSSWS